MVANNYFTSTDAVSEEGRAICANMKTLFHYLFGSSIEGSVCIIMAGVLGQPEALNSPDFDITNKPPYEADKTLITHWLFPRCMIIGVYNCATTVGAFGYWFLCNPARPQKSRCQLTSFESCYFSPEDERRQNPADPKTD